MTFSGRPVSAGENVPVRLALLSLLLIVVAVLAMRAITRDRKQYARFKKLQSTRKRKRVYAKWLRESFIVFGGLSVLVLIAAWPYVPLVVQDARGWAPLEWLTTVLSGELGVAVAVAASALFLAALVLPIVLLRAQIAEIPTVGDVGALLPRTRAELGYGAALAANAGLVEEGMFRLALPALIFGVVGNGVVALVIASLIFGALHVYQGINGVLVTTALGLLFALLYVVTDSIVAVMIVHALFDLRSLVLIPLVVRKVWRVTA